MAKATTPKAKAAAAPAVASKAPPALKADPAPKAGGDAPAPHAVLVTSAQDGFRRCGRVFGREAVEIPVEELADDELERLVADPMLDVAFIADGK